MRHGTEASGGGKSALATPIKLGFKPEVEEDWILDDLLRHTQSVNFSMTL